MWLDLFMWSFSCCRDAMKPLINGVNNDWEIKKTLLFLPINNKIRKSWRQMQIRWERWLIDIGCCCWACHIKHFSPFLPSPSSGAIANSPGSEILAEFRECHRRWISTFIMGWIEHELSSRQNFVAVMYHKYYIFIYFNKRVYYYL